ncbi:geranylgeranyl diphosphate synthase type II [Dysgonomonadaceae bacterium PH5-43]|nr:geranylgeranyl diphosphate synthase type II [Dysgonomonadaceae bacterium PH5-43]
MILKKKIMITLEDAIAKINKGIQDINYPEQPSRLYNPIAYLLAQKGKKIRPALTLLAYNLYKEDIDESLDAALAWEIYHNFTLMHDDLMDNADVRRGEPSVHKKWNDNTAILSGDAMFLLAFKFISKYRGDVLPELLDLFNKTTQEIFEGQEYDMQFEDRLDVVEDEYIKMIRLKTAVMIASCLKTGAIIANASEEDQNSLYEFGINLGLAFQIQDDILDTYGDQAVFGKNIGGDILCNKKTYLLVSALNTNNKALKKELLQWLEINDNPKEKIKAVTSIYDKLNVIDIARSKMEEFYAKSIWELNKVNVDDDRKDVIKTLAEELMNRKS